MEGPAAYNQAIQPHRPATADHREGEDMRTQATLRTRCGTRGRARPRARTDTRTSGGPAAIQRSSGHSEVGAGRDKAAVRNPRLGSKLVVLGGGTVRMDDLYQRVAALPTTEPVKPARTCRAYPPIAAREGKHRRGGAAGVPDRAIRHSWPLACATNNAVCGGAALPAGTGMTAVPNAHDRSRAVRVSSTMGWRTMGVP